MPPRRDNRQAERGCDGTAASPWPFCGSETLGLSPKGSKQIFEDPLSTSFAAERG